MEKWSIPDRDKITAKEFGSEMAGCRQHLSAAGGTANRNI
jgi:hypothetical protein